MPKESRNGHAKSAKKPPPPADSGRVAELEKEVSGVKFGTGLEGEGCEY